MGTRYLYWLVDGWRSGEMVSFKGLTLVIIKTLKIDIPINLYGTCSELDIVDQKDIVMPSIDALALMGKQDDCITSYMPMDSQRFPFLILNPI